MEEDEREVLECPVCYDLFVNCVETCCGHAFCEYCLNKCLERETICPICKRDPTPIHPSYTVRRIVEKYRKLRGLSREQITPKDAVEEKEKGNQKYKQAQYADAIKHYTDAIENSNGQVSAVLYANRAACYFKLKQYLLAVEDCDRAIQLDSNYVKAYVRKAAALEQLHLYNKCLSCLKEAEKKDNMHQFKEEIESSINRVNIMLNNSNSSNNNNSNNNSSNNHNNHQNYQHTHQNNRPAYDQPFVPPEPFNNLFNQFQQPPFAAYNTTYSNTHTNSYTTTNNRTNPNTHANVHHADPSNNQPRSNNNNSTHNNNNTSSNSTNSNSRSSRPRRNRSSGCSQQ